MQCPCELVHIEFAKRTGWRIDRSRAPARTAESSQAGSLRQFQALPGSLPGNSRPLSPQHELLDLPGRGLRQFAQEMKCGGDLEMGQRAAREAMQVGLGGSGLGPQHDEGMRRL